MVYSGKRFEITIANLLRSDFDYPILLNRQFLDCRTNKSRECDLIFITPFKIYCVECKNYNGYVAGGSFDENWRFASSGRKGNVQNPYVLNKKRIRLIRSKFYSNNSYPPQIENIIVFPDKCRIHVNNKSVYNLTDFINLVKLHSVSMKDCYKVDSICSFLEKNSSIRRV